MIGDGERVCGAFGVTVPLPLHEKARDNNLRDREEEKQCQGEGRPSLDNAANQSKAEDRQNQKLRLGAIPERWCADRSARGWGSGLLVCRAEVFGFAQKRKNQKKRKSPPLKTVSMS